MNLSVALYSKIVIKVSKMTDIIYLFQHYFDNEITTEYNTIPSIKSHLTLLGCTNYYTGWQRIIEEDIMNKLPAPYIKQKIIT